MLRAKLDKTNLTPETASAIEANLNGLEQEVDMTGWHIDVFGHPLAPRIDVTVTAPDLVRIGQTLGLRIETAVEVHNLVALEYERWQDRLAA